MQQKAMNDKEAAKYLGMSESWLRHSRTKGVGPKFIKMGRSVRYRLEDLNTWIEQNQRQNTLYRAGV